MASAQKIKVQALICDPRSSEGSAGFEHDDHPREDHMDISISEHEEIAQLTRAVESIVTADKRMQSLLKDDMESKRAPPTLWLG